MTSIHRIEPGPGQESVWDYPRPPAVQPCNRIIRIIMDGEEIAKTANALRVLETSHPPTYYLPVDDIRMDLLARNGRKSYCEYKGVAEYYDYHNADRHVADIAWAYHQPDQEYLVLKHCLAFYAPLLDACYVGDERVKAQAGDFYGGWITGDIVGPFKGEPGTEGW